MEMYQLHQKNKKNKDASITPDKPENKDVSAKPDKQEK